MRTETERRVSNCFERIELELRGVLAGAPLAKMLETVQREKAVALGALGGEPGERRLCGCLGTCPVDEDGRCLGCGMLLAPGPERGSS